MIGMGFFSLQRSQRRHFGFVQLHCVQYTHVFRKTLGRRVPQVQQFDQLGLLYYPPYHSKYNPVERCWGILEKHWNGAKLTDTQMMLEWAKTMTWKGVHPVVELSRTVYEKGVTVAKEAMQAVESRLERHPLLPKWDILIRPVSTV